MRQAETGDCRPFGVSRHFALFWVVSRTPVAQTWPSRGPAVAQGLGVRAEKLSGSRAAALLIVWIRAPVSIASDEFLLLAVTQHVDVKPERSRRRVTRSTEVSVKPSLSARIMLVMYDPVWSDVMVLSVRISLWMLVRI